LNPHKKRKKYIATFKGEKETGGEKNVELILAK
jgi:hypothetical protein